MRLLRLILSGLACAFLVGCNDKEESHTQDLQPVRAIHAPSEPFQPSAKITGEVRARIQSDLAFRTGGKVIERLADVGSRVRSGDVLARIDASEQRADVQVAQAGLRSAQASVSQKTLAFNRYQALLQSGSVARATYDQSREDLLSAQASLQVAEAALATARDALSYTELKADADGVITASDIEVGQVVSVAQASFTLAHNGPRDAVFNVFEAFFLAGQPQADVAVANINDRDRTVTATIREVSPTIDTTMGTIRVKTVLPDDAQWPLGTAVIGDFLSTPQRGIILPATAMTSDGGTPAVWVVDTLNQTVSLHKIVVVRYRTGDFIVTDGIAPGDLVVTEGGKFLSPGQRVAVEGK